MKSTFQDKRIHAEIKLLTEAFPDVKISLENIRASSQPGQEPETNNYKVTISTQDLECVVNLPTDWPFHSPLIMTTCKTHTWKQIIPDWNGAMDLRTVYAAVLNNIRDDYMSNVHEQINIVKEVFPEMKIKFDNVLNIIKIKYDGFRIHIVISKKKEYSKIYILENDQEWPEYMTPLISSNLPLDLTSLILQIMDTRDKIQSTDPNDHIEKLMKSLLIKFEIVSYNSNHQAFTIDSPQGLIIVGIDPKRQYLPPNIIVFRQGQIISNTFKFDNWGFDSNLGEIIITAKNF